MARPPVKPKNSVSVILSEMRRQLGMTQADLAQALNVALPTIGRWESAGPPTGRSLERLVRFAQEKGLLTASSDLRTELELQRGGLTVPRSWVAYSDEESHYVEAVLMALRESRFQELRVPLYRLLEPVFDAADEERRALMQRRENESTVLAQGTRTRGRRLRRRRVGRLRRADKRRRTPRKRRRTPKK
jgi:transcriptional regulator with XRE-family HTH domain